MTASYRKTGTILDRILAHKQAEIARCKEAVSPGAMMDRARAAPRPDHRFSAVLSNGDTVALIAEVKRASPSKGVLIEDFDPVALARTYFDHGAAAVSVLTDERFFQGRLDYLEQIRQNTICDPPLLRKDFIIDEYQIHEAAVAGASSILLIVAALDDARLADLYQEADGWSLDPLVEVHNEAELERAMTVNPRMIGVNNRDLKTFEVDLSTTGRLAKLVPDEVILVAESGIQSASDVRRMGELGAHAVLVGEALVRATGLAAALRAFSSQPRTDTRKA